MDSSPSSNVVLSLLALHTLACSTNSDTVSNDAMTGEDAGLGQEGTVTRTLHCVSDEVSTANADFKREGMIIRASLSLADEGTRIAGAIDEMFLDAHESSTGRVPEPFDYELLGAHNDGSIELAAEGVEMQLTQTLVNLYSGTIQLPGLESAPLTCYSGNVEMPVHYASGTCVDDAGEPARNPLSIAYVRETGWGECTDLSGLLLNANDFNYPVLKGWNLRGADLRGAQLYFASLIDVDLSGATTTQLDYGYANIRGVIDEFTVAPPCAPDELLINCTQ